MSVIVTDEGFRPDDWKGGFVPLAALDEHGDAAPLGVDLIPADPAEALTPRLHQIDMIRIGFPAFDDGRGFTLARTLRLAGFEGRMRACGHVLADQYTMARRAGFDEVEIDDDLAARQPEAQWQFRADWRGHDYQARLRG